MDIAPLSDEVVSSELTVKYHIQPPRVNEVSGLFENPRLPGKFSVNLPGPPPGGPGAMGKKGHAPFVPVSPVPGRESAMGLQLGDRRKKIGYNAFRARDRKEDDGQPDRHKISRGRSCEKTAFPVRERGPSRTQTGAGRRRRRNGGPPLNHLIFLVYFLCFSSGLGGMAAVAVVCHRIRHPVIAAYFRFLLTYTLTLAVIALYFYVREVAHHTGREAFLLFTILVYGLVGLSYTYISRLLAGLDGGRTPRPDRILMAAFSGANFFMSFLALLVLASGDGAGVLETGRVFTLALSTISLAYFTGRAHRFAREEKNPELKRIFRVFFFLLGGYLVLAPLQWALNFMGIVRYKALSLNFLFYLAWNTLHIVFTVRYFSGKADEPGAFQDGMIPGSFIEERGLTSREVEMIRLIGQGLSNKEIAAHIGVSLATVRTHIYNLYQKTGAASRVGLLNRVKEAYQTASHTKV